MTIIEEFSIIALQEVDVLNQKWFETATALTIIQPFTRNYRINTGLGELSPNQSYITIGGTGTGKDLPFELYLTPLREELEKQTADLYRLPENFSKEKLIVRLSKRPYGLLYVPETSSLLLKERSGSYQGGIFEFLCTLLDGKLEGSDTFARGDLANPPPVYVTFITTGSYQIFHEIQKERFFTQGIARRLEYEFLKRKTAKEKNRLSYEPTYVNNRQTTVASYAVRVAVFYKNIKQILEKKQLDYFNAILADGSEMAKFQNACNAEVKALEDKSEYLLPPIIQDAPLLAFRMAGIHSLFQLETLSFEELENWFKYPTVISNEYSRYSFATIPISKEDELWGIEKAKLSIQSAKTILELWVKLAPSRRVETDKDELERLLTMLKDCGGKLSYTKWLTMSGMNRVKFKRLVTTLIDRGDVDDNAVGGYWIKRKEE